MEGTQVIACTLSCVLLSPLPILWCSLILLCPVVDQTISMCTKDLHEWRNTGPQYLWLCLSCRLHWRVLWKWVFDHIHNAIFMCHLSYIIVVHPTCSVAASAGRPLSLNHVCPHLVSSLSFYTLLTGRIVLLWLRGMYLHNYVSCAQALSQLTPCTCT